MQELESEPERGLCIPSTTLFSLPDPCTADHGTELTKLKQVFVTTNLISLCYEVTQGSLFFPRLSIQSKHTAVIFSKYIFACTINLFRNHTFPFKPVTKESRVGAYLCFVLTLHGQRITFLHENISPVLRQGLAQGHIRLIHISYHVSSSFFTNQS